MVIFPKLDFKQGGGSWENAIPGIAWGVNRQPLQSTRGRRLDLVAKDIIGQLGRNPFFWIVENIIPKDPSEIPLWLFAAHFIQYQWISEQLKGLNMLWRYIFDHLSCNEMLQSSLFEPSGFPRYIMPNVLGERKQICFPDNMGCTIWNIAFLKNFFQPPLSEMEITWLHFGYIYCYILDFFWLKTDYFF